MDGTRKAAFIDLDGTLVRSTLVHAYAYYARNHRSIFKSLYKFTKVLASVPLLLLIDLYSRRAFNVYHFRRYKGIERDRLIGLSDDLFETVTKPSIYPRAYDLVSGNRASGYRNVLVTGTLDFTAQPVAAELGFDDLICNRLEYADQVATGRVIPPLIAEEAKVAAIEDYCQKQEIDLSQSRAYSDSYSDLPMLKAVGEPIATNPDRRLKKVAQGSGWPIVYLG